MEVTPGVAAGILMGWATFPGPFPCPSLGVPPSCAWAQAGLGVRNDLSAILPVFQSL